MGRFNLFNRIAFLTRQRSRSKPFWTPSYSIPAFLYPTIPPKLLKCILDLYNYYQKLYLEGRTETVRPVSVESTNFVRAMCNPDSNVITCTSTVFRVALSNCMGRDTFAPCTYTCHVYIDSACPAGLPRWHSMQDVASLSPA